MEEENEVLEDFEPDKIKIVDEKVIKSAYAGGYIYFLDNMEKNMEKIKERYKSMRLRVYYYNSNDIKEQQFAMQDKYIVEFKLTEKSVYNEKEGTYKVVHIYKMADTIKLKLNVFGIETLQSDILGILKDRCLKII
ncbi:MAG: hypothetical protein HDR05_12630 [Lachnospiraceae bacterium]|nr:hypothetical protein [Lachnospiraceae bacterium]